MTMREKGRFGLLQILKFIKTLKEAKGTIECHWIHFNWTFHKGWPVLKQYFKIRQ